MSITELSEYIDVNRKNISEGVRKLFEEGHLMRKPQEFGICKTLGYVYAIKE